MRKKQKRVQSGSHLDIKFFKFRNHHKIIFALIGVVGIILIWRGVWTFADITPFLSNPEISIILGLVAVAISGLFFKLL